MAVEIHEKWGNICSSYNLNTCVLWGMWSECRREFRVKIWEWIKTTSGVYYIYWIHLNHKQAEFGHVRNAASRDVCSTLTEFMWEMVRIR